MDQRSLKRDIGTVNDEDGSDGEYIPPSKFVKASELYQQQQQQQQQQEDNGEGAMAAASPPEMISINRKVLLSLPSILRSDARKTDIEIFKSDNNLKVSFFAVVLEYKRMDVKKANCSGHMMTLQLLHDEPIEAKYNANKRDTELFDMIKQSVNKEAVKKTYRPPIMVDGNAVIHVTSFDLKQSASPMVVGTILRVTDLGYRVEYEFRHPSNIDPNEPFCSRVNKGDPYIKYDCGAAIDTTKNIFSIMKNMKIQGSIQDFRSSLVIPREFVQFPEASRLDGVYKYFSGLQLKKVERVYKDKSYEEYDYDEDPENATVFKTFPTAYDHFAIPNEVLLKRTPIVRGMWFKLFNALPYYEDDMTKLKTGNECLDYLCFMIPLPDADGVAESEKHKWSIKKTLTSEGGASFDIRVPCIRDDSGALSGLVVLHEEEKNLNNDEYFVPSLYTIVSGPLWNAHDVYGMCSKVLWKQCGYLLFMCSIGYSYFEPTKDGLEALQDSNPGDCDKKTIGKVEFLMNPYETLQFAGLRVSKQFAEAFLEELDGSGEPIFSENETLTSVHSRNYRSSLYKTSENKIKPPFVNMREYDFGKKCAFKEGDWLFYMIPCKAVVMSYGVNSDKVDSAATVLKLTNFIALNSDESCSNAKREQEITSKWFTQKVYKSYTSLYAVRKDLSLI